MNELRRIDFMGNVLTDPDLSVENKAEELDLDNVIDEIEEKVLNIDKKANDNKLFFKTYSNFEKVLKKLTGSEARFLWAVCILMSWNNRIIFTQLVKKKIMADLNLKSEQSIKNLIVSLCKKDLLKRVDMRVYAVNDFFFTKKAEPHKKAKKKLQKKREAFNPIKKASQRTN